MPLNVKCVLEWSMKELAALFFSERFTPELAKTYKAARDLVRPHGCAQERGWFTGLARQAYEKSRKDFRRRLVLLS